MKEWVGKSTRRAGGMQRATGTQQYAADIALDHVLHVKLVHLPCARARINAIDATAAEQVAGVRCIMTAADLPDPMPRYGPACPDRPVLAVGETKFYGEPVAAIAAETLDAAEEGAARLHVDYEELPAVLTVDAALDPASPLVQEPEIRPDDAFKDTNSLNEWHFGWGDVDQAQADLIIQNTYTFPMVTHFAIEPHVFMAAPNENGVTIWSPMQHPFILQRVVASALRWPIAKVRVISPDPGGAFGGKGWPKFEPLMAYLALKTKRPVRLVLTLEETFQAVRRSAATIHIRSGFDADGTIAFQDIEANFLLGAYADIGPRVVSKSCYVACGPYRVPHARIHARALLSHTTPSTAFRGFGTPQNSWALESQLNEAAERLGIDGLEIRQRNLANRGEAFIPNDTPADGEWREALDKAAVAVGWDTPLPPNRGRGISLGMKSSSTASLSFAIVRLHPDDSATILSGTSDMGQGARTIFGQLAAQELGLDPEGVSIVMGDTAVVPFDSSTSASRSTVFMGNAIQNACRDIKQQLRRMAAELFQLEEDAVTVEPGVIRLPNEELGYGELMKLYYGSSRGEVISIGSSRSKHVREHPLGGQPSFWELMCFAAEVEVDPETGVMTLCKLVLSSDVGKALNPRQVETQDEGAAIMGLGHTLMEQLLLDDHGCIRNLGALDYRIPTIKDTPLELHSILIENGDGPGPFGAKGVSEGGLLAISAAVGAAVNQAAGVKIRDLPLTPERIWKAIDERKIAEKEGAAQPQPH